MYALRKTRDAFREHKSLSDANEINRCIIDARNNLDLIRRQVSF